MTRLLLVSILLLAQAALAGERVKLVPTDTSAIQVEAIFDPYLMVSACPFGSSWAVMWHVPPQVDRKKGEMVTFHLNEPEFNNCLTFLIRSDPDTATLVTAAMKSIDLTTDPPTVDGDAVAASTQAVKKRWSAFGVGEAITQVAETGERGQKVKAVLLACDKLKQEMGVQK